MTTIPTLSALLLLACIVTAQAATAPSNATAPATPPNATATPLDATAPPATPNATASPSTSDATTPPATPTSFPACVITSLGDLSPSDHNMTVNHWLLGRVISAPHKTPSELEKRTTCMVERRYVTDRFTDFGISWGPATIESRWPKLFDTSFVSVAIFTYKDDNGQQWNTLAIRGTNFLNFQEDDEEARFVKPVTPDYESASSNATVSDIHCVDDPRFNGCIHDGYRKIVVRLLNVTHNGTSLRGHLLQMKPSDNLSITGHSMGGGLAMLVADFLRQRRQVFPRLIVTFAAPSVSTTTFNTILLNAVEEANGRVFKIVNRKDAIPFLFNPGLTGILTLYTDDYSKKYVKPFGTDEANGVRRYADFVRNKTENATYYSFCGVGVTATSDIFGSTTIDRDTSPLDQAGLQHNNAYDAMMDLDAELLGIEHCEKHAQSALSEHDMLALEMANMHSSLNSIEVLLMNVVEQQQLHQQQSSSPASSTSTAQPSSSSDTGSSQSTTVALSVGATLCVVGVLLVAYRAMSRRDGRRVEPLA